MQSMYRLTENERRVVSLFGKDYWWGRNEKGNLYLFPVEEKDSISFDDLIAATNAMNPLLPPLVVSP